MRVQGSTVPQFTVLRQISKGRVEAARNTVAVIRQNSAVPQMRDVSHDDSTKIKDLLLPRSQQEVLSAAAWLRKRGEVVSEHPVDENVSTAHLAQEQTLRSGVEEAHVVEGG